MPRGSPGRGSSTFRSADRPPGTYLLAAMQRAVNAGVVLVIAAGNDCHAPIPIRSRSPPRSSFPGSVIIAGSLGGVAGEDVISDFSDQAGTGAQSLSDGGRLQGPGARQDRHPVHVVRNQLFRADDQRRGRADGAGVPEPHRQADRPDPVQQRARPRRRGRRQCLRSRRARHPARVPAAGADDAWPAARRR